jgi:hypothetical protein
MYTHDRSLTCVYICVSERSCVYICVSEGSCVYICVLVNGHVCTYVCHMYTHDRSLTHMYTHSNLKTPRVVKWKTNTKYHNVETVSKSNGQIIETEAKLIPLTHMNQFCLCFYYLSITFWNCFHIVVFSVCFSFYHS